MAPESAAKRVPHRWGLVTEEGATGFEYPPLLNAFRDYLIGLRKSPKTIREYSRNATAWAKWWGRKPAEFSPLDYDAWTASKTKDGYSSASIRCQQAAVRKFFAWMIRQGLVKTCPSLGSEPVSVPKRIPHWLSEEEVRSMIDVVQSIRSRAMLHLLYDCGLRNAEMRGVHAEDISSKYVRIIGKRDKERIVPIVPAAYAAVKAYLKVRPQSDLPNLFVTHSGGKVDEIQVFKTIKRAARMAGIKKRVHAHIFRHSIATHLLNRGMDLRHVQEFLGHESIETTQRYTHVAKDHLCMRVNQFHPGSKNPTYGGQNVSDCSKE